MNNKLISTMALTLVASAFTLYAQEAPAPTAPSSAAPAPAQAKPHGKHGGMHMPLFAALDANHDGVIDAQEIANAPAALKTLDKNGDGQLTRDEYRPARPEGKSPRPEAQAGERQKGPKHQRNPLIAALDANGDGVIDAQEIANASAALKTLDKNGDGQLTRDELRPARPEGDPGMKDGGRKHRNKSDAPAPAPSATPAP